MDINNERLDVFLQDIINLGLIGKVVFHKWFLHIPEKLSYEIENKNKWRSLNSISIEEWSFGKETVVNLWNSVEGLSSIDISNNILTREEALFIRDNLKNLDIIYNHDIEYQHINWKK